MPSLSERVRAVIDGPNFAHVATLDPDGHPHNTVMWITRDDDRVILNTAEGRRKWRNLRRDPRLAISISPQDAPYVNFSMRGRVVEMRTEDGDAVIDALAAKYLGVDTNPYRRHGARRVTMVVEIEHVAIWE